MKRLLNLYFLSAMLLNIVIPTILIFIVWNGGYGEAALGFIAIALTGILSLLFYLLLFIIPSLPKHWERVAMSLLPALLISGLIFYLTQDYALTVPNFILGVLFTGLLYKQSLKLIY